MSIIKDYLAEVYKIHESGEATEHSYRSPLERLLKQSSKERSGIEYNVLNEPKQEGVFGRPDFVIRQSNYATIGYVETKDVGKDLEKELRSDQIKKYKELSDNIILTDYLSFIHIQKDEVSRVTLCSESALQGNKVPAVDKQRAEDLQKLFERFFSATPRTIHTANEFATELGKRSRRLMSFLEKKLQAQVAEPSSQDRLYGIYSIFFEQIYRGESHALERYIGDFSDAYSQTLVYGLFIAKQYADADAAGKELSLHNVQRYIPRSFALTQELTAFLGDLNKSPYKDIAWVIEEILGMVNDMDSEILESKDEKDPLLYFYENFLKAHDEKTRKDRGVYYTPPQIVKFIVQSINHLLQAHGLSDGLSDKKKVTLLDFATGTGTFLLEVFRTILADPKIGSGNRQAYIREHLLQNIYGFELLVAPYVVAQMNLSRYLKKEEKYTLREEDSFKLFLTNTLENTTAETGNPFMPELSKQAKEANNIKNEKPVLVVTGNPPYNSESQNNSKWIKKLQKDYTKGLNERNPKPLNDDYIKFIRFAQYRIDKTENGIVGIITNNSFYSGKTHRKMRKSLMESFDSIYVLNLHGSSRKTEKKPEDGKDENVFNSRQGVEINIRQGVGISIMLKTAKKKKGQLAQVHHAELWGLRKDKLETLEETNVKNTSWKRLKPIAPYYFFKPLDTTLLNAYEEGYKLTDIFSNYVTGISAGRDEICMAFSEQRLKRIKEDFLALGIEQLRDKYKLPADTSNWSIECAKKDLTKNEPSIKDILYRPFDNRKTLYTGKSKGFQSRPRHKIMQHMLKGKNIGLLSCRIAHTSHDFDMVFATTNICDKHAAGSQSSLFPLYRYENGIYNGDKGGYERIENLKPDFRVWLSARYGSPSFSAEAILGYLYAILYSRPFREKYAEYLTYDFARIPFPKERARFEAVSALGEGLIAVHLLEREPDEARHRVRGLYENVPDVTPEQQTHYVEKIDYRADAERLYINPYQYFDQVSAGVMSFSIGGYKVLEKYLKARKRGLELDEREHVSKMVRALSYTCDAMDAIEAATEGWI